MLQVWGRDRLFLLNSRFNPIGLVLFGSYARGDAEPGSDIDILVVLYGDVNTSEEIARTSEMVANISLRYDVVVSLVFMSQHRYDNERSPFLINIRREGRAA